MSSSAAKRCAVRRRICFTNYAMLEYLLIRPADLDLFDGPNAGTWRFIVMDEAHVYDGAQGTEVALLMRASSNNGSRPNRHFSASRPQPLTGSVRNDPVVRPCSSPRISLMRPSSTATTTLPGRTSSSRFRKTS